jgi:hypothetical protein
MVPLQISELLSEMPKAVACLLLPLYAGLIGGSLGGFLVYAIAAACGLTVGEQLLGEFGQAQGERIVTSIGFWFGQALIFGSPAFGLGRAILGLFG